MSGVRTGRSLETLFHPKDDRFLEMPHLGMKSSTLMKMKPYHVFQRMSTCVLRLLFGGQTLHHDEPVTDEDNITSKNECQLQNIILSIGQDLVHNVSGGKKWTPKHLGLACTLHQSTISKGLVQLFHNAGHIISYDSVPQVDTALAESTVKSININTGSVIPPNLINNIFVYFSRDNIDISDSSLDGKYTFHATQVTPWHCMP